MATQARQADGLLYELYVRRVSSSVDRAITHLSCEERSEPWNASHGRNLAHSMPIYTSVASEGCDRAEALAMDAYVELQRLEYYLA